MDRDSRAKRSENCSAETLMSTSRPSLVSRARHTSPIAPAPIGATISYGPSLSPTESGIGVISQVYLVGTLDGRKPLRRQFDGKRANRWLEIRQTLNPRDGDTSKWNLN